MPYDSWRVLLRRTAIFVFMTIIAILAFMSILTKFVTDTDLARRLAEYSAVVKLHSVIIARQSTKRQANLHLIT